jgi:hypothetical protein
MAMTHAATAIAAAKRTPTTTRTSAPATTGAWPTVSRTSRSRQRATNAERADDSDEPRDTARITSTTLGRALTG